MTEVTKWHTGLREAPGGCLSEANGSLDKALSGQTTLRQNPSHGALIEVRKWSAALTDGREGNSALRETTYRNTVLTHKHGNGITEVAGIDSKLCGGRKATWTDSELCGGGEAAGPGVGAESRVESSAAWPWDGVTDDTGSAEVLIRKDDWCGKALTC